MSLLELRNLSASYGVSQALFDVTLSVDRGEVVALMGRNGMGKSTTVKSICRLLPSTGTLLLDGDNLHTLPSFSVAQRGVGLVPEGRRCFKDLTTEENLLAAACDGAWTLARVKTLFPRLGERMTQRAASLSGGEQQMLAIGRALMTNPRLLILDEATEGLAPIIRQEIWAAIKSLKQHSGLAILVIDKSVKELSQVADKFVILERGKTIWTGAVSDLTTDISARHLGV